MGKLLKRLISQRLGNAIAEDHLSQNTDSVRDARSLTRFSCGRHGHDGKEQRRKAQGGSRSCLNRHPQRLHLCKMEELHRCPGEQEGSVCWTIIWSTDGGRSMDNQGGNDVWCISEFKNRLRRMKYHVRWVLGEMIGFADDALIVYTVDKDGIVELRVNESWRRTKRWLDRRGLQMALHELEVVLITDRRFFRSISEPALQRVAISVAM